MSEDHDEREPLPIEPSDLDVCPECGAPMREADTLICLRCGYDMAAGKVLETEVAASEPEPASASASASASDSDSDSDSDSEDTVTEGDQSADDATEKPADAIVQPGNADPWLGVGLFGASFVALAIGVLAGAPGLFPRLAFAARKAEIPLEISWVDRMEELVRVPVLMALWTGAAFAALRGMAWYEHRPFGDRLTACSRLAGLVAVARLVAYLAIPWPVVAWPVEAVMQAAIFYVGAIVIFRQGPRDAGILVGATAAGFGAIWCAAHVILFVT